MSDPHIIDLTTEERPRTPMERIEARIQYAERGLRADIGDVERKADQLHEDMERVNAALADLQRDVEGYRRETEAYRVSNESVLGLIRSELESDQEDRAEMRKQINLMIMGLGVIVLVLLAAVTGVGVQINGLVNVTP